MDCQSFRRAHYVSKMKDPTSKERPRMPVYLIEEFIRQYQLAFAPQACLYTELEDCEDVKPSVLISNIAGAAAGYYKTWSKDDRGS